MRWTVNKYGKSLYFDNVYLIQSDGGPAFKNATDSKVVPFKSNIKRKRNTYVEEFIPRNHVENGRMNYEAQKAEFLWCNKALRLLYTTDFKELANGSTEGK